MTMENFKREGMNKNYQQDLSILFIVPSDYNRLIEKGVEHLILERDEGGFFKEVFTVHPCASKTQILNLNETHQLIEFGPDYPLSFLKFKFGKAINYRLKFLLIIKALSRLIRREHINVIRATDPYWCGFYAWAVSKFTGIPFCISIHADYDKNYRLTGRKRGKPLLFKLLERFTLPRAHLVMPISEYLGRQVINQGATAERVRIIPHGINIEGFLNPKDIDLKRELKIPDDKKILCMVGRLSRQKYVYDALELAHRLVQRRQDFILTFVGDGEEKEKLQSISEEKNLSSMVRFVGFQPNEMVASILKQSYLSLCLLAGFALIESCASGIPAVCYDIEWHRELMENGETGFIVKEGDLDALTEAVVYLLDHPEKAKKMGVVARQLAVTKHDIFYTSEVKKDCYKELLHPKRN